MTTASDERAPELDLQLPEHRGRAPVGMRSKVNGAGNRIVRPHTIGDRLVLVCEVRVKDAGHKGTAKDGLLYEEKLVVEDLFEITDSESARELLVGLRQRYRAEDDARKGVAPLFDAPAPRRIGWLDASGRLLSDEDWAELQGLEVPSSDEELAAAEDRDAHEALLAPRWLAAVEDGDTDGYDGLTAAQIIAALRVVSERSVIIACAKYEGANKDRKGVRAALDARLADLSDPE